jgi:hypothetical protein
MNLVSNLGYHITRNFCHVYSSLNMSTDVGRGACGKRMGGGETRNA